jgi:hypothetical protein
MRNYGLGPEMVNIECDDNVLERSLGTIAHMMLLGRYQKPTVMSCCTANGNQGYYYAWEAAVRHSGGISDINLFYTRFSEWLDLISYLPYEGKVIINNKATKNLNVRIPGWTLIKNVCVKVNGNVVTPESAGGRYIRLSGLNGREEIEITFPQPKRTLDITVPLYNSYPGRHVPALKVNLIGSTVIGFEESGEADPSLIKMFEYPGYYKKYRSGEFAEKEVSYYAPEKSIKWY